MENSKDELDQTRIHPEFYPIIRNLAVELLHESNEILLRNELWENADSSKFEENLQIQF
jgi:transcriptional accessory protein Tex/SPT6